MYFNFSTPPRYIVKKNPDVIWENSEDKIILSFDDGPDPDTTLKVLLKLNEYKIKAIFFLVGNNIENHPNIVNHISKDNIIANHSFNHSRFFIFHSEKTIIDEIKRLEEILSVHHNFRKYFRPPYGYFNSKLKSILKNYNYKLFLWSILTEDYLNSYNRSVNNLKKNIKANSILVFHNNKKAKNNILDLLDYSINIALEKGYTFESNFNF